MEENPLGDFQLIDLLRIKESIDSFILKFFYNYPLKFALANFNFLQLFIVNC